MLVGIPARKNKTSRIDHMKKLRESVVPLSVVILAASSSSALAEWHVGVEASSNDLDAKNAFQVFPDHDLDERDGGYGLFAGYRFNKYFSVQVGYRDYGAFNDRLYNEESDNGESLEIEVDSWALTATGDLPLSSQFSGFAEIGVVFWDIETDGNGSYGLILLPAPLPPAIESGSGTDLVLGAGVRYLIDNNWSTALSYRYFEFDQSSTDIEVSSVALSVEYSFH